MSHVWVAVDVALERGEDQYTAYQCLAVLFSVLFSVGRCVSLCGVTSIGALFTIGAIFQSLQVPWCSSSHTLLGLLVQSKDEHKTGCDMLRPNTKPSPPSLFQTLSQAHVRSTGFGS